MTNQPLLEIENVSKAFPGVQALKSVSFSVNESTIHALVGENGAGKSTLMKILAGVYQPDSGVIRFQGQPLRVSSPADSQRLGIRIIYQEFNLLPHLSIAENILLDREPRNRFGLIDWRKMYAQTRDLLALLEMDIDPRTTVQSLTVAQQQIIEIVKALAAEARLLIMDEPTAALNPTEVDHLYKVIRSLQARGTTVIFISHRLDEVIRISSKVTVMKDGQHIITQPTETLSKAEIVRHMVGRSLEDIFPPRRTSSHPDPMLEVSKLHTHTLHDISFQLFPGEILGLAGLEGHGQRELARALFGLETIRSGEVRVNGEPLALTDPRAAIGAGIVFISDDRKIEGLALSLAVRENVALPNLKTLSKYALVNGKHERHTVSQTVERIGVKTPSIEQGVRFLSGGNQQKTVLAKWMIKSPRILVFVEPTRGIDIGAKVEIYRLMHDFAEHGAGVIIVSSELLELIGLSSRVLVMRNGRVHREIPGDEASEERIMMAATDAHHE